MTTRRRSASASQIAALAAVVAVALIVLAAIAWPLVALVAKSSGVVAATATTAPRDGRGLGLTLGAGELSTPLALFARSVAYASCAALAGLAVAWPASRAVRLRGRLHASLVF